MATRLHTHKVLVVGGYYLAQVLTSAELYDPTSGTWAATGSMHQAHNGGVLALLPDGRVLVAGGLSARGQVLASAEIYDPQTEKWSATGSMLEPTIVRVLRQLDTGWQVLRFPRHREWND
jgi:hypothetical protein